MRTRNWEAHASTLNEICFRCTGTRSNVMCVSEFCPVYFERMLLNRRLATIPALRALEF